VHGPQGTLIERIRAGLGSAQLGRHRLLIIINVPFAGEV
jgi:hypothetical protein